MTIFNIEWNFDYNDVDDDKRILTFQNLKINSRNSKPNSNVLFLLFKKNSWILLINKTDNFRSASTFPFFLFPFFIYGVVNF